MCTVWGKNSNGWRFRKWDLGKQREWKNVAWFVKIISKNRCLQSSTVVCLSISLYNNLNLLLLIRIVSNWVYFWSVVYEGIHCKTIGGMYFKPINSFFIFASETRMFFCQSCWDQIKSLKCYGLSQNVSPNTQNKWVTKITVQLKVNLFLERRRVVKYHKTFQTWLIHLVPRLWSWFKWVCETKTLVFERIDIENIIWPYSMLFCIASCLLFHLWFLWKLNNQSLPLYFLSFSIKRIFQQFVEIHSQFMVCFSSFFCVSLFAWLQTHFWLWWNYRIKFP